MFKLLFKLGSHFGSTKSYIDTWTAVLRAEEATQKLKAGSLKIYGVVHRDLLTKTALAVEVDY